MIKNTIVRVIMGLCGLLLVAAATPLNARDAALPPGADFQEGFRGANSPYREKRAIPIKYFFRLLAKLQKRGHHYLGDLNASQMQTAVEVFLGQDYTSLPRGRLLSKDKSRQVRFGRHEISSNPYHMHFEVFDKANGGVFSEGVALIKDTYRPWDVHQ